MPPDQLASSRADAVARYRRGVALLRRGRAAQAIAVLRDAAAADGGLAVALAALAVAESAVGCVRWQATIDAASRRRDISRRERQHVAIVALALAGNTSRASALAQEHLHEFPRDDVVALVVGEHVVD